MAFLLALLGTRRSPGWGLAAVVGVGYFSGAVRANYPSMGTTFMFDFAVLGVYAGTFLTPGAWPAAWASPPGAWVKWLVVWPALLTLVPVHDPFIQLVGLRASVWYVPVLLIAYRLGDDDLTALARGLAGLNLIALAVGVYLYQNGIEALYPRNAITELMYRSGDVAGGQYRIPSTFLNAHGYGGTMLLTAPFLIDRLARRGVGGVERVALAVGLAAAVGGILLCAARTPFLIATAATALAWPLAGMSVRVGAGVGVLVAGVLVAAGNDERLSRGLSALDDTDTISERAKGGANEQFPRTPRRLPSRGRDGERGGRPVLPGRPGPAADRHGKRVHPHPRRPGGRRARPLASVPRLGVRRPVAGRRPRPGRDGRRLRRLPGVVGRGVHRDRAVGPASRAPSCSWPGWASW